MSSVSTEAWTLPHLNEAPPTPSIAYAPARLARYSANDSALWMACCLPFGSFGSYSVGAGSRVASPPPKPLPPWPSAGGGDGGGLGADGASPPAARLARYSANDSALLMACCLPFGSLGSYSVGAGSRVASPPPKPLPPIVTWDAPILESGAG